MTSWLIEAGTSELQGNRSSALAAEEARQSREQSGETPALV